MEDIKIIQMENNNKIQRDINIDNEIIIDVNNNIQRDTNIDNQNNNNQFVSVTTKTCLMNACETKNYELINNVITNEKHTINYVYIKDIISISKHTRNKIDLESIGKTNNVDHNDICCCFIPFFIPIVYLNMFRFKDVTNKNVKTALSIACSLNDIETMKLLIRNGADVNDNSIFVSVCKNNINTLKLLIEHGANINKIIVVERKYDGLFRSLHNVKIERSLFEDACMYSNTNIINFLIESGVDVLDKSKCIDIIVKRSGNKIYQKINNMTVNNNYVQYSSIDIIMNCEIETVSNLQ